MCKRRMISSYRVPQTVSLMPGYWQQPLRSLGPGCMLSSLGLRMDDHTTRIAVSCCSIWVHHSVNPTTAKVMLMPSLLTGSAVSKAKVVFLRHAAINAIIHRSLAAVNLSSTLSPLAYADQMVSD